MQNDAKKKNGSLNVFNVIVHHEYEFTIIIEITGRKLHF